MTMVSGMHVTPSSLRAAARDAIVYAGCALLLPLCLVAWLDRTDALFAATSELLSLVPGKLGIFARRSFYRMTLSHCATDVHIGFGTTFAHSQATIGRGVYIGNRCSIGLCSLDDHVTIGSNVDLLSGRRQHRFDAPNVPIQEQGGVFEMVHVGRNAWLGNSSVILADVGASAVVGAGSVVIHSVTAGAVVAGNPAQIKRQREVA
ncbi:MAG: acyltransferase [Gemmataceae bacterium]